MSAACPMLPRPARILGVSRETRDTVTLAVEAAGGGASFRPGQFSMLYAFGVGEVPISMSGDPLRTDAQLHTVRAVGAVTNALCGVQLDDVIGVRGPFGSCWPIDLARGQDLLVVAGGLGLAPLRPALYQALARREDFRRIVLLVGARSPSDLLFRAELEALQARRDLSVLLTVDHASGDWRGRVGVVTALLAEVDIQASSTLAFVCGPDVMMRFAVRELGRRGVQDCRIHVSMERNMKCAVGLCGHCQYGPSFVCKDGPVIPYDRLRPIFWGREI